MLKKFEVEFLEQARDFILSIEPKAKTKLLYNIDKAQFLNDPKVFKKIDDDIWEFRCESIKLQYRLLAFWDKRKAKNTLVICARGFIKKVDKVPKNEIEKAKQIMKLYFQQY
ncbi:MAG: type II toxin-antitoxin system RelE/ParE family toxin [Bacteroidetes bacterium]|nr:type II toxin-antitoxin system RelE/ParE family toxin [Bacteroidota bacterium]